MWLSPEDGNVQCQAKLQDIFCRKNGLNRKQRNNTPNAKEFPPYSQNTTDIFTSTTANNNTTINTNYTFVRIICLISM